MPAPADQCAASLLSIGDAVATLRRDHPEVTRSSLRFLEREGLIAAARTRGGHRLYTPDDLDRIRQIKTWQAQRLTLDQIRQRLDKLDRLPPPQILATTFVRQATEGDRAAAAQTILSADDVSMPLLRLVGDVLQPAMDDVGGRWERGELLVAQEKETSELTRDVITELMLRHACVSATGPVMVAGCVEGERHELGLRIVCGLLATRGYRTHYLGADVPPRFLLEAARLRRPDAILLSVKLDHHLHAAKNAIETLSASLGTSPMPRVIVGGDAARRHSGQLREWGATPVMHEGLGDALAEVAAIVPGGEPAVATLGDA